MTIKIPPNLPLRKGGTFFDQQLTDSPLWPEAGSQHSCGVPNGVLLAGKRGARGDLLFFEFALNRIWSTQ